MTVLVGYPLTRRAREVLDLAAMFARSRSEDLVVCSVIAHPLMTENKRASQEIYDEAQRVATNAFERAHRDMPDDVHVEYRAVASRSILRGILDTAKEVGASLIVAGADTSPVGKITLSTVADRLLHGSSVPVAVASRGLLTPKKRISRVTLAFTGSKNSHAQVAAAQEFADSFEVPLRLATFAINLPFPPGATSPARESGVRRAWEDKMHTLAHDATPAGYDAPEFVIGRGREWDDAIDDVDWQEGDIMLLGSSEQNAVAGVFIGTNASRILRKAPVPVVVLPKPARTPRLKPKRS